VTISVAPLGLAARLAGLAGGGTLWWVVGAVVVGLLGAVGVQTVRLSKAEVQIADLRRQAEKDRGDRLQLVAAHNLAMANSQAAHARTQQEIIDGFITQKLALQAAHAVDMQRVRRVHDNAVAAAAADRAASKDDPAACQRIADRNQALYGLVDEGFGLAVEGRRLLGTAAAEIDTLMALIKNDRAAICGEQGR